MRTLLLSLVLVAAPLAALAEGGRYQAVAIPDASRSAQAANVNPKVLILDTVEGHLWTWGENETVFDSAGRPQLGTALIYQGRVRPGSKMGDVIERRVDK